MDAVGGAPLQEANEEGGELAKPALRPKARYRQADIGPPGQSAAPQGPHQCARALSRVRAHWRDVGPLRANGGVFQSHGSASAAAGFLRRWNSPCSLAKNLLDHPRSL